MYSQCIWEPIYPGIYVTWLTESDKSLNNTCFWFTLAAFYFEVPFYFLLQFFGPLPYPATWALPFFYTPCEDYILAILLSCMLELLASQQHYIYFCNDSEAPKLLLSFVLTWFLEIMQDLWALFMQHAPPQVLWYQRYSENIPKP
jgi:hypothetical protein